MIFSTVVAVAVLLVASVVILAAGFTVVVQVVQAGRKIPKGRRRR